MTQFQVGTEVYLFRTFDGDGSETRHRVAKVYKNGRLVLHGVHGQWSPCTSTPGKAHKAGGGYNSSHLRIVTPEVEELVARRAGERKRVDRMYGLVVRFEHATARGKWKHQAQNVAFLDALEAALKIAEGSS
jgi:hypothetical protein